VYPTLCFAIAANSFQQLMEWMMNEGIEWKYPRVYMKMGLCLKTWVHFGVGSKIFDPTKCPEKHREAKRIYAVPLSKIMVEPGLYMLADENTPCNCLTPFANQLRATCPWIELCNYCSKEGIGRKLDKCGGCGEVRYCCRQCQRADWPNHKTRCRQIQKVLKQAKKS
jgi:MYND finger